MFLTKVVSLFYKELRADINFPLPFVKYEYFMTCLRCVTLQHSSEFWIGTGSNLQERKNFKGEILQGQSKFFNRSIRFYQNFSIKIIELIFNFNNQFFIN